MSIHIFEVFYSFFRYGLKARFSSRLAERGRVIGRHRASGIEGDAKTQWGKQQGREQA